MEVVGEELALDEAVSVAREVAAHHEPCKGGEQVGPGANPPPLSLPPGREPRWCARTATYPPRRSPRSAFPRRWRGKGDAAL